jgi:hypothetical protein
MKNFIATFITVLLAAADGAYAFPSTGTTALREEASKKGIFIGSGAINPTYLNDPEFAAVLANQFNSLFWRLQGLVNFKGVSGGGSRKERTTTLVSTYSPSLTKASLDLLI